MHRLPHQPSFPPRTLGPGCSQRPPSPEAAPQGSLSGPSFLQAASNNSKCGAKRSKPGALAPGHRTTRSNTATVCELGDAHSSQAVVLATQAGGASKGVRQVLSGEPRVRGVLMTSLGAVLFPLRLKSVAPWAPPWPVQGRETPDTLPWTWGQVAGPRIPFLLGRSQGPAQCPAKPVSQNAATSEREQVWGLPRG